MSGVLEWIELEKSDSKKKHHIRLRSEKVMQRMSYVQKHIQ